MIRKLLDRLMERAGYVRTERLTMSVVEIRGMEKERYKLIGKCEQLTQHALDLQKEVELVNDENQSLWAMLDEMQGSNTFGKDQVRSMMDDLEQVLTDEMLKDFKPIGEA